MGQCVSKKKTERKLTGTQELNKEYTISNDKFVKVRKDNIKHFYELGAKINEGSFGCVYTAKHLSSGKKRAVKTIPIRGPNGGNVETLLREVTILKSMDHPNIIKVFEVFNDSVYLNIVTELCRGGDLFDRIVSKKNSQGSFSENTAASYLRQMCSAVLHMHNKNVVHRDLKPENMIFESNSDDSELKLIDFGTCKHFTKKVPLLETVGSSYYMAPEVIGGNYNEKCDVWSLGVILYILLSGEPPFNGGTDLDIKSAILTKDPSFEGRVWKSVSNECKNLLLGMLNKKPDARMTAREVYDNPWLKSHAEGSAPDREIASRALKNLSNFAISTKFHRATLAYIVNQMMSNDEVSALSEIFKAIDKNGDGLLSHEEIKEAMNSITGSLGKSAEQILQKADEDKNGFINYSEFLTAAINWEKELSRERLHEVFKEFDKDNSGAISVEEFIEALGGDSDQRHLFIDMIKDADKNHDGQVDLQEFCEFMEQAKISNRI